MFRSRYCEAVNNSSGLVLVTFSKKYGLILFSCEYIHEIQYNKPQTSEEMNKRVQAKMKIMALAEFALSKKSAWMIFKMCR